MVAQVATRAEAAVNRGLPYHLDFRKRHWVPVFIFLVDVAAVETALFFGFLTRYALSSWWPIDLVANTYTGLALPPDPQEVKRSRCKT